jgi:hypothetical protein
MKLLKLKRGAERKNASLQINKMNHQKKKRFFYFSVVIVVSEALSLIVLPSEQS